MNLTSLPKDKFLEFIAEKNGTREYYSAVYDIINENKIVKWNWGAAFFNLYWLFYRRLYKEAIIGLIMYFILTFLIAIIFPYLSHENEYICNQLIWVPIFATFGFFGNYIYISFLVSRIEYHHTIPKGTTFSGGFLFFIISTVLWGSVSKIIVKIIHII